MDHDSLMAELKNKFHPDKMTSPASSNTSSTVSASPCSSTKKTLTYQVSPGWAESAVVMTGTSVEISINQLKELYFQSKGKGPMPVLLGDGKTPADIEFNQRTEAVTITLQPQLGRPFSVIRFLMFGNSCFGRCISTRFLLPLISILITSEV